MSRGNSLIASVILIGILSTLSIALQATTPTPEKFTASSVPPRAQVAAAAAPSEIKCIPGFFYLSWNKTAGGNTGVVVECRQVAQCTNGFGTPPDATEQAYKTAGASADCINNVKSGKKSETPPPMCTQDVGKCTNLFHCFSTDRDGKPSDCKPVQLGKDEKFIPQENQKMAIKQAMNRAAGGSAEDTQFLKDLQMTNPQMTSDLDKYFGEEIQSQKDAVTQLQENLAACQASPCNDGKTADIARQLEAEKNRLTVMTKMKNRLSAQQAGEAAVKDTGCTPNCGNADDSGNGNDLLSGLGKGLTGFGKPPGGQGGGGSGDGGQQQQNPYQQCNPKHYCLNNALYWGTQQEDLRSSFGRNCQQQLIQNCQHGCRNSACVQDPQNPTPTGDKAPTASLTCGGGSDMIDVGKEAPIKFECKNSTGSTGSGFSTKAKLSGTATTTIEKPSPGVNTVEYGLTCTASNNQTASARCEVKVNRIAAVMVANPATVQADSDDETDETTIGWVTVGMKGCTLSADDSAFESWNAEQAKITNTSGIARAPDLDRTTEFKLMCTTKTDQKHESTVKVQVE